jgi:hypothetical protein
MPRQSGEAGRFNLIAYEIGKTLPRTASTEGTRRAAGAEASFSSAFLELFGNAMYFHRIG